MILTSFLDLKFLLILSLTLDVLNYELMKYSKDLNLTSNKL